MAGNIELARSTKFVSIDTHPANNALVVTYEILAAVVDKSSGHELAGRNKRHQLQVNISALDKLTTNDLKANKLIINIQALSDEILNKCPLLQATNRSLQEDIQLHLLYLVGRRQSQLLMEQQQNGRPPSTASMRFRSARTAGQRSSAGTKRITSSASSTSSGSSSTGESDFADSVYSYLHTKVLSGNIQQTNHCELFLEELDEHLELAISGLLQRPNTLLKPDELSGKQAKLGELDVYLEGLYGDNNERLNSMAKIRDLVRVEAHLEAISANRLLVCAIIRTLRDLNYNQNHSHYLVLSECIFYCLIRFTMIQEVFLKIFEKPTSSEGSDDLVLLVAGFLSEIVNKMQADLKSIFDTYYYTNSLLVIILNLLSHSNTEGIQTSTTLSLYKVEQKILFQQAERANRKRLLESLIELFCLQAKCLKVKDIPLISKPQQIISSLSRILTIMKRLSTFKEFTMQLRNNQLLAKFVDSLVGLIDTLQLTRPGSGGNNNASELVSDKQTINELYELEIIAFMFINNILYDVKIRSKLINRNLLKCVLRNLVIFFAKSNQTILSSYDQSVVLLAPFKSLYELSCDNIVKMELYKSKIVMKCLLEYLLSCSIEFKSKLELLSGTTQIQPTNLDSCDQIIIEASQASHYIICIWINLSARHDAPIYGSDLELKDLVAEYLELITTNILKLFAKIYTAISHENQLVMYLHLKLLRNFTQFLKLSQARSSERPTGAWLVVVEDFNTISRWFERLEEASSLFADTIQNRLAVPLAVECLAVLTNILSNIEPNWLASFNNQRLLSNLIEKLLSGGGVEDYESENDDLLLVSIILLGTLARRLEICSSGSTSSQLNKRIIRVTNFILSSRATDDEMLVNTLYTILQLTNHGQFLKDISGEVGSEHIDELIEKLTLLTSNPNGIISKLSVTLLNRLAHLEEQMSIEESVIKRKRFAIYNSRWLSAMKLAGDDTSKFIREGNYTSEIREQDEDEERQFYLDSELCDSNGQLESIVREERGGPGNKAQSHVSELESIEEDDMLSDDDEVEGSFTNEPDLNVIDSNSMIKHLTSRRHFRSSFELLRR